MSGPVDTSAAALADVEWRLHEWAASMAEGRAVFRASEMMRAAVIIRALAAERDAALANLDRYAADAGRWRGIAEAQEREIAALRARIASLTQPLPEPDPGASHGPPEAAGEAGARGGAAGAEKPLAGLCVAQDGGVA